MIGRAVLDWLQNFRVRKVSLGLPGLLHEGFVGQPELIWDAVLGELNDRLTPPLYVTGHSQGGAVAALATSGSNLRVLPSRGPTPSRCRGQGIWSSPNR